MNLEQIETEWAKDSEINLDDLSNEAVTIPKLHSKYHKMLTRERMRAHSNETKRKQLEHLLTMYYSNRLTTKEMQYYELPPLDKTYIKQDIPHCVDTHPDMVELKKSMSINQEKIELLKSILSQIHQRSFQIRDAIEFRKFQAGS